MEKSVFSKDYRVFLRLLREARGRSGLTQEELNLELHGYCIFIDTLLEGHVPAVRNEKDEPVVFEAELAAQREMVDHYITRLQEFLDGERDFEDAIGYEEFIVEIDILPNGWIVDADENYFGPRR